MTLEASDASAELNAAEDPLEAYMSSLGSPTPQRATWTDADADADAAALDASALRVSPPRRRSDGAVRARNRRYEHCRRRLREGDDYFGDAQMRERDCRLFDELYGSLDPREVAASTRDAARDACVRAFCERFLNGAEDVNYASIDGDERLDDLDELARDAQDRYFAAEDE